MSTAGTLPKLQGVRELPQAKPLDEAVWRAWVLRGRAQEERSYAVRMKAVKWISLAGLLLVMAAGLWSQLTPYDVVVRFLVAAGALALMSQAFHTRHYAFATAFGALALLYNPVAPAFSFQGIGSAPIVVASAVPFVASLTWRNAKLVPNE
jgi:hypothetical protein